MTQIIHSKLWLMPKPCSKNTDYLIGMCHRLQNDLSSSLLLCINLLFKVFEWLGHVCACMGVCVCEHGCVHTCMYAFVHVPNQLLHRDNEPAQLQAIKIKIWFGSFHLQHSTDLHQVCKLEVSEMTLFQTVTKSQMYFIPPITKLKGDNKQTSNTGSDRNRIK